MIRVLFVKIKPLTNKTFCCIILKNRGESMAMKVTPPEANVINAVDVIEHILGRDGLIEQNKDILLKPILFNEITLEDDY